MVQQQFGSQNYFGNIRVVVKIFRTLSILRHSLRECFEVAMSPQLEVCNGFSVYGCHELLELSPADILTHVDQHCCMYRYACITGALGRSVAALRCVLVPRFKKTINMWNRIPIAQTYLRACDIELYTLETTYTAATTAAACYFSKYNVVTR